MDKRAYITGLGGQGVMFLAKLYTKAAYRDGKDVLLYPTYGGEQRGGASNAAVMVSDKKVGAPSVALYDTVVYLHQKSYDLAPAAVKPGAVGIFNTAMVKETKDADIRKVLIDANAEGEALGSERAANMVLLGALIRAMDEVAKDTVLDILREEMAEDPSLPLNEAAIRKGYELAEEQLR